MYSPPKEGEYAPFYQTYISTIDDTEQIVEVLEQRPLATLQLTEEEALFQYAPGKWSAKEAMGHLIDTERVMAYRAMCIARGETKNLPGFDQDEYMKHSFFNDRSWNSLIEEYKAVRAASLQLVQGIPTSQWERMGSASQHPVSVRALVYIIAGHERHHVKIYREKYKLKI